MKTMEYLQIEGEVYTDPLHRIIYSSDASAYCEEPLGVMYPRNDQDLREIIAFARRRGVTLIPRAAGTSLAGQVVGAGWVVDISKYMNAILEIQPEQRWVRVQPGVVLDELNLFCKDYGLFFAPETSTSNRCQIGGMIGNNSCGSHSLVYGSTRAHLLEAKVLLSDGSEVVFKPLTPAEVDRKQQEQTLEGAIYRGIIRLLSNKENQKKMIEHFPDRSLTRRNSGYALDQLLYTSYFDPASTEPFNLCKILAGSEGTFALITEAKLNLEPLPPSHKGVVALHCHTLEESFRANLVALTHKPRAIELIDGKILELSKQNIAQSKNRFFIQGDPEAVLIIEFAEHSDDALHRQCEALIADLRSKSMGYAYPVICGGEIAKVWELRKAGLGLLSGMVGDAKPVSVVEDTAVAPERLPDYMADFRAMMDRYGLSCVYHAHISTGELHLRPILNLKSPEDRVLFRKVAQDCVLLVKKHRGSLSGEHGDGRLRGEFLPLLFGAKVYALMKEVKMLFDCEGVFNRGKIIDTPPMDHSLRYKACDEAFSTYFDYSSSGGYLRAIERCNGAGDCRKSAKFAGVMCPVFKALGDERYTTRARANILRDNFLNRKPQNYFHNPDVLALLD
ncbi:MAG: FAD-binding oxidoreductase, partial [Alistipes sp.]|nr:FAD-binding oxidoreductase [Alistipes sp.]